MISSSRRRRRSTGADDVPVFPASHSKGPTGLFQPVLRNISGVKMRIQQYLYSISAFYTPPVTSPGGAFLWRREGAVCYTYKETDPGLIAQRVREDDSDFRAKEEV